MAEPGGWGGENITEVARFVIKEGCHGEQYLTGLEQIGT